jgi:voltage-gated potassium channel Kch
MEENEEQELFDYYIEIGAISVIGVDDDGEFIYQITEEAKELAPELWEAHLNYVDDAMMQLYKKDLVEVEYDEDLQPTFKLGAKGLEAAKQLGLIEINFTEEEPL